MKSGSTTYVLKEYGSWSVLSISFLIGLGVSRAVPPWTALPLFMSLGLLINSKQAYTQWSRRAGDRKPLMIFLGQVIIATIILAAVFGSTIPRLLPLLIIPTAYLLMARLEGEHAILTELLGFSLLSLAAVLAKYLVTEGLDVRLYVGVATYFIAGVFKIKTMLFRKLRDRLLTILGVIITLYLYHRFHVTYLILLPLIENIVAALTLYTVRLQTTGWIEVVKSLAFMGLFIYFY